MKFSLRTKILGSFALIILLALGVAVGTGNRLNRERYDKYSAMLDLNRARVLARVMGNWTFEAVNGSPDGDIVTEHPFFIRSPQDGSRGRNDLLAPRKDDGIVGGMMDRMGPEPPEEESLLITDLSGRVLLDTSDYGGTYLEPGLTEGALVRKDDVDIGYLYLSSMIPGSPKPRDIRYLQAAGKATWAVAAIIFVLSMGLGLLLTMHIVGPVRTLNRATSEVKAGDLGIRVPDTRKDELGDLARGFNAMTASLEDSDRQRRRLIADSAHELRTPVSLIRTRIEMMEEGIYPMNSDSLSALAEESNRLVTLVKELGVLADLESSVNTPEKTKIAPGDLVKDVVAAIAPAVLRRSVELSSEVSALPSFFEADSGQIHRLLANLLNNALRFAEHDIRISSESRDTGFIVFRVEDDGPGIPAEFRERVFERYFRVDASRSRDSGGSGLGLAICREIAVAHGGTISAGVSGDLGGAEIEVSIPLN